MRKVMFTINDVEYMCKYLDYPEGIFSNIPPFEATFIIYGSDIRSDETELLDKFGNKIDRNTLNGYHTGVILADCYAYFEGRKYYANADAPWGVIKIEETEC